MAALATLAPSRAAAQPFEDLGPGLGLPEQREVLPSVQPTVGSSFGDLDGDGDLDLVTTGSGLGASLYRRVGVGAGFRRDPTQLEVGPDGAVGNTLFDMDGDGDLDLLLLSHEPRLYANDGSARFEEVTASHLPSFLSFSVAATAVDVDADGDLDLFVANDIERSSPPWHRCGENRLLENDGRGVFRDVTEEAGISGRACTLQTAAADLDLDGDLDLVAIDDFAPYTGGNVVWLNDGLGPDGVVRFHDGTAALGWEVRNNSMGLVLADLDGRPGWEALLTNIGEATALSQGPDGVFRRGAMGLDAALALGLDGKLVTWTVGLEDLDADARPDLLVTASHLATPSPAEANAPVQSSLFLSGVSPSGWTELDPNATWGQGRQAARDLAFEDLDRDQRPEIILSDTTGRIAAYKNLRLGLPTTTLELVPSTTGRGALGAEVALGCGAARELRRLTGGARYGVSDRGVVRFSLPTCPGTSVAAASLRWPSGYTQELTFTPGRALRAVEPEWLIFDPATGRLSADFGEASAPPAEVALETVGLEVSGDTALHDARLEVALRLAPGATRGYARLVLDGRPGPVVRLADGPQIFLSPPRPTAGAPVSVWVRGLTTSSPSLAWASASSALTADGDAWRADLVAPPTPGPSELVIHDGDRAWPSEVVVHPAVDLVLSELVVRGAYTTPDAPDAPLLLRAYLRDASNRPVVTLARERLSITVDGAPHPIASTSISQGAYLLEVARPLPPGARVRLRLDGQPVLQEVHTAALASVDELGRHVDPARSRCILAEPRLAGDGEDRGTLVAILRDASGTDLPTLVTPTATSRGASVVVDDPIADDANWYLPVRAGRWEDAPDRGEGRDRIELVELTLPGMIGVVPCEVFLRPPIPPAPVVAASLYELPMSRRRDPGQGEIARVRWVPLGPHGRGVGPGVEPALEVEGGSAEGTLGYVGGGGYEVDVRLEAESTRVVVTLGALRHTVLLSLRPIPPEPGPEPGPELVEAGPELVEAEPELVEAEPELGDEAAGAGDVEVEPLDDAGPMAEVVEPVEVEPSEDLGGPSPDEPDGPEGSDTGEETSTRSGGGCSGGGSGSGVLVFLIALNRWLGTTRACGWRRPRATT